MTIPNHIGLVQAAREEYTHLSGLARGHAICARVVWTLRDDGWGRFRKSDGTLSADVIGLKAMEYPGGEQVYTFDILADVEGECVPQWGPTQPTGRGELSRWVAPVPVEEPPAWPPPEPPVPPTEQEPDLSELAKAIDVLIEILREQNDRLGSIEQRLAALTASVADVKALYVEMNTAIHQPRGVSGSVSINPFRGAGTFTGTAGGPEK
jgi:hypothetical protein